MVLCFGSHFLFKSILARCEKPIKIQVLGQIHLKIGHSEFSDYPWWLQQLSISLSALYRRTPLLRAGVYMVWPHSVLLYFLIAVLLLRLSLQ